MTKGKSSTKRKTCVHYWDIDSSHHGICRYCGAEQDFPSWDDLMYAEYKSSKRTANSGKKAPEGKVHFDLKVRSGPPRYEVAE